VNNQGNSLHYNDNSAINNDWWNELGENYAHFPKEYKRNFSETLDKRFLLIWMVTFIVHFSIALYFAINPPATSFDRSDIDRIQKQFATLVLEKTIEKTEIEPEPSPVENLTSEKTATYAKGQSKDRSGSGSGSESAMVENLSVASSTDYSDIESSFSTGEQKSSREKISKEVSSKGLLGLLTGSGSNAKGEEISDVLGEAAGPQGDLDKTLGNLEGLKKSGKSSIGTASNQGDGRLTRKGTRSTESGGIDELIAGKGQVKSTEIQRTGNIVVEEVSEITDERGIKSESRNSDKVSEVINRHNSSIQYCYQRELKQNPDLKGKLAVRFTITPEGKVGDVKVISSTLNSPSIERCVISRIKRWDDFGAIDQSKGEATFRQVYTFGY
jgi:TonB family protein